MILIHLLVCNELSSVIVMSYLFFRQLETIYFELSSFPNLQSQFDCYGIGKCCSVLVDQINLKSSSLSRTKKINSRSLPICLQMALQLQMQKICYYTFTNSSKQKQNFFNVIAFYKKDISCPKSFL